MKKYIVILFLFIVCCVLLSSSSTVNRECFGVFEGYRIDGSILNVLPENIVCTSNEITPRTIQMIEVNGVWHLIYINEDGKKQAHMYFCWYLTGSYNSCTIWEEKMNHELHAYKSSIPIG